MDKIRIGYFLTLKHEESYIGGVMITDENSIPIEFKYTDPITPTRIHKIIFGKVLEKYINEDVIKKTLLKEIVNIPKIYFVTDLNLIGKSQNKVPIVAVMKTTLSSLSNIGEFQRVKDKEFIIQPATMTNPLKIIFHTEEPDVQESIMKVIKSFIDKIDIYEPFSRVEKALISICQKEI